MTGFYHKENDLKILHGNLQQLLVGDKEINNKIRFLIPSYQRAYSFNITIISRIMDDIKYKAKGYNYSYKSLPHYSMGKITAKRTNDDNYEIVDSQERLRMFLMIIRASDLRMIENNARDSRYQEYYLVKNESQNNEIKVDHSPENNTIPNLFNYCYREIFLNKKFSRQIKNNDNEEVKNLLNSWSYIYHLINSMSLNHFKNFINFITKRLVFVLEILPQDESAENSFSNINLNRVPIDSYDIIKQHLVHQLKIKNASDIDIHYFQQYWKEFNDIITRGSTKSKADSFINIFLINESHIYCNNGGKYIQKQDISEFVIHHVKSVKDILNMTKSLLINAKAYIGINHINDKVKNEFDCPLFKHSKNKNQRSMYNIKIKACLNIMLNKMKSYKIHLLLMPFYFIKDSNKIEKLILTCLKLVILQKMNQIPPQKMLSAYTGFIKEYYNDCNIMKNKNRAFHCLINNINNELTNKKLIGRMQYNLSNVNFVGKEGFYLCKGILLTIEILINKNTNININSIDVDHILPNNACYKKGKFKGINEKNAYQNKIGNLTLLEHDKNIEAGDSDFRDKANDYYFDSNCNITRAIVGAWPSNKKIFFYLSNEYEVNYSCNIKGVPIKYWTKNNIDNRSQDLAQLISNYISNNLITK